MTIQQFLDDLGLDIAVEQVGENPDLPPELDIEAVHYRVELMLYNPYRAEHFFVSAHGDPTRPPHPYLENILLLMVMTMNDYLACPTADAYIARFGLPDFPGVREHWESFAQDEARLERLLGERYDEFLALDPRLNQ